MTIHNDKLTNFLREHAPEAPDPKPGEMRRILEQIEASEKRWSFFRFLFSPKSLVPATVLAGVLAFLLIPRMHSPLEEPTELFLSQTVGDLFATEDETSANSPEVAWLTLAESAVPIAQRDARIEEFLDTTLDPSNDSSDEEWL